MFIVPRNLRNNVQHRTSFRDSQCQGYGSDTTGIVDSIFIVVSEVGQHRATRKEMKALQ